MSNSLLTKRRPFYARTFRIKCRKLPHLLQAHWTHSVGFWASKPVNCGRSYGICPFRCVNGVARGFFETWPHAHPASVCAKQQARFQLMKTMVRQALDAFCKPGLSKTPPELAYLYQQIRHNQNPSKCLAKSWDFRLFTYAEAEQLK